MPASDATSPADTSTPAVSDAPTLDAQPPAQPRPQSPPPQPSSPSQPQPQGQPASDTPLARVDALRKALDEAQHLIARLERRHKIENLLLPHEPIDLETARLLTEVAIEQMDQPDLALVVADLRQHKPYLFRPRPDMAAMPPRQPHDPDDPADEAAAHASATGHRRDLLRYLRLRRRERR